MNIELQEYYENRFEMMSSQGWKDLCEDLEQRKQAVNQVYTYDNINSLMMAKGELSAIDWILNLKELSELAYQDLKEDDASV